MFFINKFVVCLLMFMSWFGVGFLVFLFLNLNIWGVYDKFEGICWLLWEKGNFVIFFYFIFYILIIFGFVIFFIILVIIVIVLKKNFIYFMLMVFFMLVSI